MQTTEIKLFAQLVYDYCGLHYINKLPSLALKMQKRLQQLNMTYWEYMRYVQQHEEEWTTIIDLLTINETYFFREDKQFTVLQQHIAPTLLQRQGNLSIWCAACSTGDEPYSIAMMLQQKSKGQINILGTDINARVLQIAKNGTYNKNSLSFRRIPSHFIPTYFDDYGSTYVVKPHIRNMVRFEYKNLYQLNNDYMPEQFDVIFCRNVLIYFDDEGIEKIIQHFERFLKPGGYLFLGHAETITKYKTAFHVVHHDGTFYYQKGHVNEI